jgi:hypothetical protein
MRKPTELKPQDILVLLKLAVHPGEEWSYSGLASSLKISSSEAHAAIKRATLAGLMNTRHHRPIRTALEELLIHGVKYVFPAERGPLTRGLPTAHAAPPLASEFISSGEPPPVWPDPEGPIRGETLIPLYRSVPQAARKDERLYEALALVDAIRAGRARERKRAEELLRAMLGANDRG